MTVILHVEEAKHIERYRVWVRFNDASSGEIDLEGRLTGPIFEPLCDVNFFRAFNLQGHTLAWPNGADFAPEYLHSLLVPEHARTE